MYAAGEEGSVLQRPGFIFADSQTTIAFFTSLGYPAQGSLQKLSRRFLRHSTWPIELRNSASSEGALLPTLTQGDGCLGHRRDHQAIERRRHTAL